MSTPMGNYDPLTRVRLWKASKDYCRYVATHLGTEDPLVLDEHHARLRRLLRDYAGVVVEETDNYEGWIWLCPRGVSSVFGKPYSVFLDACMQALKTETPDSLTPHHWHDQEWNEEVRTTGEQILNADQPFWLNPGSS